MNKDLNRILKGLEFHDKYSCLLDLSELIIIANKHQIKLKLKFDWENYKIHDLTIETYNNIVLNQSFSSENIKK